MVKFTVDPEANLYHFETADLQGTIRPGDVYHGVQRLLHKQSGIEIVHPRYSTLNLFRLFSVNLGMGQPRRMERTVEASDNSVEIYWPATVEHHASLTARYTVEEPNRIDLTITVRAEAAYPGYELFLSSYFNPELQPHVYLARDRYNLAGEEPELVAPKVNDVIRGVGLVYPRDTHAARRCVDGRWDRRELESPTAQFAPVRFYAVPVCFQADADRRIAAVIMSRPEDCFAVVSGYNSPDYGDAWKGQNPLYLSLFGDDLRHGDQRTVRVRMVVAELDETASQPLALYREFIAE